MALQAPLEIRIITCMCSRSRLIGLRGDLPWRLAPDLAHFRQLTAGGAALIGRKSYEEALQTHPSGLTSSPVCVLTRSGNFSRSDGTVVTASSVKQGLQTMQCIPRPLSGIVWVMGGAEIFREALSSAKAISMTLITDGFDSQAAGVDEPDAEAVYFPAEWQEFFEPDEACSGESHFDPDSGLTYEFREFVARRARVTDGD
ncbi:unnamed protein product [Polarella glacialis]|uniref:Bifunctional dihydrofolate reductase-thymidylate synthase n=1 Tax=Polarella glacialis TaxID=89957 RepID=A0A813FWR2_POLGL|nr:unnamed protein product [Polarella glacialis]